MYNLSLDMSQVCDLFEGARGIPGIGYSFHSMHSRAALQERKAAAILKIHLASLPSKGVIKCYC